MTLSCPSIHLLFRLPPASRAEYLINYETLKFFSQFFFSSLSSVSTDTPSAPPTLFLPRFISLSLSLCFSVLDLGVMLPAPLPKCFRRSLQLADTVGLGVYFHPAAECLLITVHNFSSPGTAAAVSTQTGPLGTCCSSVSTVLAAFPLPLAIAQNLNIAIKKTGRGNT